MNTNFVLLLLSLSFLALPAQTAGKKSASASASASGLRCEKVFDISVTAEVSSKGAEKASAFSSSLILVPKFSQASKEIVFLRDGYAQQPPRNAIPDSYAGEFSYYQDSLGDKISIKIYPDANPFSNENPYNQAQLKSSVTSGSLTRGQTSSSSSSALTSQPSRQSPSYSAQSPSASNEAIAREYVLKLYEGRQLDETTIRMAVQTIVNSRELMSEAIAKNTAVRNSRMIELTNHNLNRYFWFIPDGQQNYVAARVLDIHRRNRPLEFTFLIEYHSHSNDLAEGSVRTRIVQQLSLTELKSIQTDVAGKSRLDATQEFIESLSPDEIQTLRLAKQMGLRMFGYFNINRGPSVQDNWASRTPLEEMNSIVHLAINHHITSLFGPLTDLLTNFEKTQTYVNYMDVFSRLNPKYVMERFANEKTMNSEFYWIITEDGQLKVIPAMHIGNNLKPQILRFAHGRRVFAGGTFNLNADGSLRVKLNANGYQQADAAWGDSFAFSERNPNLESFVNIVFGVQMGRRIDTLNAEKNETWYRAGTASSDDPYFGSTAGARAHQNYGAGARPNDDFFSNLQGRAKQASEKKSERLSWDLEKSAPVSMREFVMKFGMGRSSDEMEWAHYVLQTDSSMAWGDIKKKSRKLLSQFHPDKFLHTGKDSEASKRATQISQLINEAITLLEKELKP